MKRLHLGRTLAESRPTRLLHPIISQTLPRRCLSIEPTEPSQPTRNTPDILDSNDPSKYILNPSVFPSRSNSETPFGPQLHKLESLPSPDPSASLQSAKLAALHARLYLPPSFPVQTLARCLVDKTADEDPSFNNAALATIGRAQLAHLMTEYLVCKYPRLPTSIIFMAQEAYLGPSALEEMTRAWGVEEASAPGGEVDPGLLQFNRELKSEPAYEAGYHALKRATAKQQLLPIELQEKKSSKTESIEVSELQLSNRVMHLDQFGQASKPDGPTTTIAAASSNFVYAVVGALYLHLGRSAVKAFFTDHVLSRHLDISKIFSFKVPNRDLLLLCRREGFEPPVPRLISETGRLSSHPVFIVGIYSGLDKLGEGAGGSIKEAKFRATVAALKGWYLYSPVNFIRPSEVESRDNSKKWAPNYVDCGEVIC